MTLPGIINTQTYQLTSQNVNVNGKCHDDRFHQTNVFKYI